MMRVDFEECIDAYEEALITGSPSAGELAQFLPPRSAESYWETLVELLRITLEHQWRPGEKQAIERFRRQFPDLFDLPHWLDQLAFEEYRLRTTEGQGVQREEYFQRYGLDVSRWPDLSQTSRPSCSNAAEKEAASWIEFSQSDPAAAAEAHALRQHLPQVGQRFGPFELLALLGQGAFGKVFLARQKTLADRFVALKVTFGRPLEAQKLARLQHGNIVPVYSVHRRGKLSGICMPYLGNGTLADLIQQLKLQERLPPTAESLVATLEQRQAELSTVVTGGDLLAAPGKPVLEPPAPRALRQLAASPLESYFAQIIRQVAAGLAQAHERGIIHRDLKPANILISDLGEPLLLDFNLAEDQAKHAAHLGGTLPYMAPEQLALFQAGGANAIDARSDIYSLGVVLYECLTAKHPFPIRRGSLEQILPQMVTDRQTSPTIPVRQFNVAVSPGLAAIVQHCLEANPASRYQRAIDLYEDLNRHLESLPLKFAQETSPFEKLQKWCRRHPRLSSLTSVVSMALLLAAIAGGIWNSREQAYSKGVAQQTFQRFEEQALEARSLLVIGAAGSSWESQGFAQAQAALKIYGIGENADWLKRPNVRHLDADSRQQLGADVAEILLLLAQRRATLSAANSAGANLPSSPELERQAVSTWKSLVPGRVPRTNSELTSSSAGTSSTLAGPADITELVQIAAALPSAAKLDDLEQRLRRLVAVRPRDAFAWLALGHFYLANNRFHEAEAAGTAAVALRSELDLAWQFRGLVHMQQQQWQPAERDFSAALALRPHSPTSWFNRGLARQSQQNHSAAVEDFTQALGEGFPETRVYFSRARSQLVLGNKAAAELDRIEGLKRHPLDSLSYVERGLAQLPDHPQQALDDLEQAVRLNPTSLFTLMNLAHVQSEQLNQTAAGIETLGKLLEHYPHNSDALGSRAVLLARLGSETAALADLRQLLVTEPRPPLVIYQAACVYALLSKEALPRRAQAVQLLATALAIQPGLVNTARTDPDLTLLHNEPGWNQLVPPLSPH